MGIISVLLMFYISSLGDYTFLNTTENENAIADLQNRHPFLVQCILMIPAIFFLIYLFICVTDLHYLHIKHIDT